MMCRTCPRHKNVALDVTVWELMVDDLGGKWGFCRFALLHFLLDFSPRPKNSFGKHSLMVLQAHDTSDPCQKVTFFDSVYHCFTSQGTLPSVKSSYDVHFLSQYERVNICWLLYWLLQF